MSSAVTPFYIYPILTHFTYTYVLTHNIFNTHVEFGANTVYVETRALHQPLKYIDLFFLSVLVLLPVRVCWGLHPMRFQAN